MSTIKKALVINLLLICVLTLSAAAQISPDVAVRLYQGPNATGAWQGVPPGTYKVDGNQLAAAVGKDAVFSVQVSKGSRVRFCEDAGASGGGKCEEFGEGTHNLRSTNFALIKVWRETNIVPPVIVFEAPMWAGRSQIYVPGMYRAERNEFGNIIEDKAMSAIVAKGYRARFCVDAGLYYRGAGDCEIHEEGKHNLRFADRISFIEVIDLNDKSPADDSLPVVLYEDSSQGGKMQGFDVGTFLASKGQFRKLANDTASSVIVKSGYRAKICPDELPGDGCEEFGPGKFDLKRKDTASYVSVWKVDK